MVSRNNPDPSQTQRLRDNKRRHRARQKEYTASLEHRLRVFEQEGVQATVEVQVSARKVLRENRRLRALLKEAGVAEATVESWLRQPDEGGIRDIPKDDITSVPVGDPGVQSLAEESPASKEPTLSCTSSPPSLIPDDNPSTVSTCPPNRACERRCQRVPHQIPISHASATPNPSPQHPPPCKLMTHLSINPSADLTQLPLPGTAATNAEDGSHEDGVPCKQAYQMLIQYATTEPKMDAVAKALEEGCTPSTGEGGGCRVRKEAVWKALDDICL